MGGACILPRLAMHVQMQIRLATARNSNFSEQQTVAVCTCVTLIDLGDITKHVQHDNTNTSDLKRKTKALSYTKSSLLDAIQSLP